MDLLVWVTTAILLLSAVQADPTDQGPQMFKEDKPSSSASSKLPLSPTSTDQDPKELKRQQRYETKEIIMYLTPSQIRAYEAGQIEFIRQPSAQVQLSREHENLKEQLQNTLHGEGQELQREYAKSEADRKQRLQLQEAIQTQQAHGVQAQQIQQIQINHGNHAQSKEQPGGKYLEPVPQQQWTLRSPQLEQFALNLEKQQWIPDNYAYMYFYPRGKSHDNKNLQILYPESQGNQVNEQLLIQRGKTLQLQLDPSLQQKFEFVPYEYGYDKNFEAQLQGQLEAHQLESHRLEEQQLEAQRQLKANLEIQQKEGQKLLAQQLEAHQLQSNLEAHQNQQKLEDKQIQSNLDEFKAQRVQAQKLEIHKLKAIQEAHNMDAHLEAQQLKAEQQRLEQQHLKWLREYEPKKLQMNTLLSPLIQYQNIIDSFSHQSDAVKLDKNEPKLEGGFIPLQYAPKYTDEKYAKEVENMSLRNQLQKHKAFIKAAEIANEPPVIIHKEITIMKPRPIHVTKHVNIPVPTPFYVPVPEPFEVKVPQPYPVPIEIIKPVPVPILKTEKIEVERPVPIEVEKHVPVPFTKNVYIKVDKPYIVKRIVPVEIKKEIPVEIPIHKPQKFTLIRHIWDH